MADPNLEKQLETYFTKGDSLYSIFADPGTPVFEKEGDYPDIPLFTKEGKWNPAWDERGLSDISREGGVISGTNVKGQPERRTITRSSFGAPPRQQYLSRKMGELDRELPFEVSGDIRTSMMKSGYMPRDNPLYSKKGEIWSPFKMAQIYRDETKDMSFRERIDFDAMWKDVLGNMATEKPTANDRVFEAINE